jgi:saccharopine dehydrogenase-like NADP-dependent oxidoreductase
MKNVLVLGAGMVAGPLVRYLLEQEDFRLIVASLNVSKAQELVANHPKGKARLLDVTDTETLKELVSSSDLAISLLPYDHHMKVANYCIQHKKPMVTTSYVSSEMQALDERVRDAGIVILNEIGLDPGIDHMSAMRIIHGVQDRGGEITSFRSYCGALPAPEAATNPFRYKFAWSPRGAVLAGKNNARYLRDGEEVYVPGDKLCEDSSTLTVEGLGELAVYPNRDSLGYIQKYGIQSTKTMFRGTLRYPGWCETWLSIGKLGLLDEEERELKSLSYKEFTSLLIGKSSAGEAVQSGRIKTVVADHLQLDENSPVLAKLEWLGLFGEERLPIEKGSPLDVFSALLIEKLKYEEGERDMVVLHHASMAEYPGDRREKITSTLIDYGQPAGDTAVARTVALPAAIATKLILQEKTGLKGVLIPTAAEIYEPVLEELEELGIVCTEKTEALG